MTPRIPDPDAGHGWWHDGHLWYPTLSGDCRQRYDGQRWRPLHPEWQVLRVVALVLLGVTPLVWLLGFAYVASEPLYPGEPEPPFQRLVALGYLLWPPLMTTLLWWASHQTGSPAFPYRGGKGRRSRRNWAWEAPPGWPTPPPLWLPNPGWQPRPRWPAPPPEWRGWVRRA